MKEIKVWSIVELSQTAHWTIKWEVVNDKLWHRIVSLENNRYWTFDDLKRTPEIQIKLITK